LITIHVGFRPGGAKTPRKMMVLYQEFSRIIRFKVEYRRHLQQVHALPAGIPCWGNEA